MRALTYSQTGEPDVLTLAERPVPEPGPGEVGVRVHLSGANPTDWKSRRGSGPGQPLAFPEVVPGQDGAGVVERTGPGVSGLSPGQRVWLWEAGWGRPGGTAQEQVVLPAEHVVALPDGASFELGASLGIPALTAHRCLTVAEGGPTGLHPAALAGRVVLVAGGAGAVGHAAIQLARWAGATVLATVSGADKAALARAAGAQQVVNYRAPDATERIRELAPDGVNLIVEVAPAVNAALDTAVLAAHGTVSVYATNGGEQVSVPVRANMSANTRYQFVLVYTVPASAKAQAVADVRTAVEAGALPVGESAGLPLHRFALADGAAAHAAVEAGITGKVLLDVLG